MDEEELVQRIRDELEYHGIDPESVYPVSTDGPGYLMDPNEVMEVTVTFNTVTSGHSSENND